ncbi:hypothetical protein ANO11243_013800 [Dothideomycetidae sp. 11243]|nr:hypothetical protein ANO11243_013800 [fungal sp. No.11243]
MAGAASRSPSPVIAPPVAASPGPRAAQLMKLYNDAISHTLKACNYDNFAACFPTTAANVPEALQGLHQDFVDRLEQHCKSEFEAILRERGVIASLNDLDRLIEEARRRKVKAEEQAKDGAVKVPLPPHALPARSLYLAHLGATVEAQQAQLSGQLEQLQAQNEELLGVLEKQRNEIEHTVGSVEAVITDLDSSLQSLPTDQMQDLTRDAVTLDTEVRAGD